jgi:hypothetical protein
MLRRLGYVIVLLLACSLMMLPACGGDDDDDNDSDDDSGEDDDTDDDDDSGDDDSGDDDTGECPDLDEDGFTDAECGGEDCNDEDPAVNPDATEICGDAIDNDCDGTPEDGCYVWETETVAPMGAISGLNEDYVDVSLGFSDGLPAIAYYHAADSALRVAFGGAKGWTVDEVAQGRKVGQNPDLAVSPTGDVGVVYRKGTVFGGGAFYAVKSGGTWTTEEVGDYGGYHPAIEYDAAGDPHVLIGDYSYTFYYGIKSGGTWTFESAASVDGSTDNFEMALDSNGYPFVSMTVEIMIDPETSVDVWGVAFRDDVGWQVGYLTENPLNMGAYSSVTFDSGDNPVIAVTQDDTEDLLAYWWQGHWSVQTIESAFSVGKYVSAAQDADGKPAVSYYNTSMGSLSYAHYTTQWEVETADKDGNVGRYTSLAFDDDGNPAIAYYDYTNQDLKYAHRVFVPEVE